MRLSIDESADERKIIKNIKTIAKKASNSVLHNNLKKKIKNEYLITQYSDSVQGNTRKFTSVSQIN